MQAAEEALFADLTEGQCDEFVEKLSRILLNIRQLDF